MSDPVNRTESKRGTDSAPGRARRRKALPIGLLFTDSSEQLPWPMHQYASKYCTFIMRDHWNLPEADYAAMLINDASDELIRQVREDDERPKAIRSEALAIRSVASRMCLIERKSLSDFCSTMTVGHKRFADECQRMSVYGSRTIVVEGDIPQVIEYCRGTSMRHAAVLNAAFAFHVRGTPVMFASDRRCASATAFRVMEWWIRERAKLLESDG